MMTSQSNCQKISKVPSVLVFTLDTGSLALSSIGVVIELIGLLGGPAGEGGALATYQMLNAAEGGLGVVSSIITASNDFLITGETYVTTDPQPELVLGSDTTIAFTTAIVGGLDPEAASDTLLNSAAWANDLFRLTGGEGFLQTHLGLSRSYLTFGSP
jgi:hypothetical protein